MPNNRYNVILEDRFESQEKYSNPFWTSLDSSNMYSSLLAYFTRFIRERQDAVCPDVMHCQNMRCGDADVMMREMRSWDIGEG